MDWDEIRRLIAEYGIEQKPIWVTEYGYSKFAEMYRNGVTPTLEEEKEQARWLAKRYVTNFGEGVDKIFHIEILGSIKPPIEIDSSEIERGQQGYCLYPEDEGRPRLAFFTRRLLASKIGFFHEVEKPALNVYKFTVDDKQIYVLWDSKFTFKLQSPKVRIINLVPLDTSGWFEVTEEEVKGGADGRGWKRPVANRGDT